jgi:hypothetical protein
MNKLLALIATIVVTFAFPVAVFAQEAGDRGTTSPDAMSDFTLWAIVGGMLTSVVTAVINRNRWSSDVKLAMFFALCCVTAAGNAYVNRELDFENWSRSLLIVLASGWTAYLAAKPAIKTIEARTG